MTTSLVPRTPRMLLSLALVAALGVPGVLDTKQVTVTVDGEQVRDVRTHADTVGDVLARQGVDISPADEVVPALDAELVEHTTIRVAKAVRVRVVDQLGRARRVLAPMDTVEEVLDRVDLPEESQLVWDDLADPVVHGDVVRVRVPVEVTILDGQGRLAVRSADATVADLLDAEGLTLAETDRIAPALDAPVRPEMSIAITRVASREEVDEVVLPFDEERRETDELLKGKSRVVQEGVEGLRRDTYLVTNVDGRDVSRERTSSVVVSDPQTRIVEVGTKVPPPPEPREDDSVWYRLARCESGGRWSYNGAYDGGLQFHPTTWNRWKPSGYPDFAYQASATQQIQVGKRLHAARGWSPWPSCARKLGLL